MGAWIQSRREHKKWIRERRYEAYADLDATLARIEARWVIADGATDRRDEVARWMSKAVVEDFPGPVSRLNLVGPDRVVAAKDEYLFVWAHVDDASERRRVSNRLKSEMRAALGITN